MRSRLPPASIRASLTAIDAPEAGPSRPTARLFAALWLPGPVVADLGAALATITAGPQIRLTRQDTWHLTLAFLGEVPEARSLQRFARLAGRELPAAGPLRLEGSGTFGPVAWAGVAHGAWLPRLADILGRELRVADRRFRAHVTVARARGGDLAPTRAARGFADALAGYAGPSWNPTEVLLVESLRGPAPQYPVRARLALT